MRIDENRVLMFNTLGLIALSFPLIGALVDQLIMGEYPCPLCLLQRMAMFLVAAGILMNLRFGIHQLHYGISILGALIGASISLRQILLHIVPVTGESSGYGPEVLGMHLYTWAFVIFCAAILAIALAMILFDIDAQKSDAEKPVRKMKGIEKAVFYGFIAMAAINVLAVFLECGIAPCLDNPTSYKLLEKL